ncbi:uroporphyrinogen-III synthase [Alcanivorax jadensis]|uniref:uroporphyrinogen-III synthase n=1 Tax=Alcanivorax jadensis TaxID=64988 RepID=UPI003567465C
MQVLVTRPRGQQQALMDALRHAGHEPLHSPALHIEPLPLSDATRRVLMDLDLFHAVFFASSNAARLALSAMADLWPQWPVGVHWLAVGKATAAEISRWHLQPTVPNGGFNSEAVLSLPCLQQLAEKKVLLCRGESGRELLAQTLAERGAEVVTLPFYRRLPSADFHCPESCDWVMVTSVESWQAISEKIPAGAGIVAAGERVAAHIRVQHTGPMRVALSAHDEDMLTALTSA